MSAIGAMARVFYAQTNAIRRSTRLRHVTPLVVAFIAFLALATHQSCRTLAAQETSGQASGAQHPQQGNSDTAPVTRQSAPIARSHLPMPQRPASPPEKVARGKALFQVNCAFCHGADALGGSVGPNLRENQIVTDDKDGELLAPIIHGARADRGMPAIQMTQPDVSDVAAFLHSFTIGERVRPSKPIDIVVGNASEGKITFDRMCGSCHSVTGDLAGIASKLPNARNLQQAWLLPGGPRRTVLGRPRDPGLHVQPVTVTVTLPSGEKITGTLERIDDFYVGLQTSEGDFHSFARHGDEPKVEIHDPIAPHRALLRNYTDQEIHDITAYLVTIK